jgi:hypothetical protein
LARVPGQRAVHPLLQPPCLLPRVLLLLLLLQVASHLSLHLLRHYH